MLAGYIPKEYNKEYSKEHSLITVLSLPKCTGYFRAQFTQKVIFREKFF